MCSFPCQNNNFCKAPGRTHLNQSYENQAAWPRAPGAAPGAAMTRSRGCWIQVQVQDHHRPSSSPTPGSGQSPITRGAHDRPSLLVLDRTWQSCQSPPRATAASRVQRSRQLHQMLGTPPHPSLKTLQSPSWRTTPSPGFRPIVLPLLPPSHTTLSPGSLLAPTLPTTAQATKSTLLLELRPSREGPSRLVAARPASTAISSKEWGSLLGGAVSLTREPLHAPSAPRREPGTHG